MAVVNAFGSVPSPRSHDAATTPGYVNLCTSLTGNVDTTNTADRMWHTGTGLIKIVSTVGSTPTVTLNLVGSMDGTNWFNFAYAATATPETVAVAALTINSATTSWYLIRPNHPWRYFKGVMSANTNVTLTIDVWFPPTAI